MKRWLFLVLGAALAGAAGGCGPLLDATVTGHVMLEGKPLTNGTVTFHPVDARRGVEAAGEIDVAGNFKLRTQDLEGALNGEYKVTVAGSNAEVSAEGAVVKKPSLITPMHYGLVRQSPLRYRIKPGVNVINLNLELADRTTKLPGAAKEGE